MTVWKRASRRLTTGARNVSPPIEVWNSPALAAAGGRATADAPIRQPATKPWILRIRILPPLALRTNRSPRRGLAHGAPTLAPAPRWMFRIVLFWKLTLLPLLVITLLMPPELPTRLKELPVLICSPAAKSLPKNSKPWLELEVWVTSVQDKD